MSNRDPFEVEDSNGDVIIRGHIKGEGRIEPADVIPETNHTPYNTQTLQEKVANLFQGTCTENWHFKEY